MKFSIPTLSILMFLLTTAFAQAAIKPYYQDIKLPTQKMVERQSILNPGASTVNSVLSAHAGATSASAVNVTTFAAQPDVPRNLSVTPGGSTNNVAACVITITGTDINDNAISDTFTFSNDGAGRVDGVKAFKTVTNIGFPASCEDQVYAATWSVGYGEKLGIKRCLDKAGHIFFSTIDGAKEATAPTIAADASIVSKNTADYNGTMNGSSDFELFFMQNYRCTN